MIIFEAPLADKSTGTLTDIHSPLELQLSAVTLILLQLPEQRYRLLLLLLFKTEVCSTSLKTGMLKKNKDVMHMLAKQAGKLYKGFEKF